MKSTLLKQIAKTLRESDNKLHKKKLVEAEQKDPDLEGEDSLDDQIDKYLTNYEAEAKNVKTEGLDFRMMTRRFLSEAEEDEEGGDEDKKEDKADDEKGDDAAEEKPEKLTSEDINVSSFVNDVMRLVDNFDTLLEVQNTILRRAANFLLKNYEKDTVESFKEELLESYGLEIGKTKSEKQDELEFQPPKAGAAGPAGGGGA